MKKIIFTLLLFIPLLTLSQGNNIYRQTSEFSFHTIQKDTLYLNMLNCATPGIISVWTEDISYNGKPVIIILPDEEFHCILSEIEDYIVWSYVLKKSLYPDYQDIRKTEETYEVSRQSNLPTRFRNR